MGPAAAHAQFRQRYISIRVAVGSGEELYYTSPRRPRRLLLPHRQVQSLGRCRRRDSRQRAGASTSLAPTTTRCRGLTSTWRRRRWPTIFGRPSLRARWLGARRIGTRSGPLAAWRRPSITPKKKEALGRHHFPQLTSKSPSLIKSLPMSSPPPTGDRPPAAGSPPPPPRILRRTQPHQPSRAAVPSSPQPRARPSSWDSFFLDSPPPPPAQGQPDADKVDLVPETPDLRGASTDPAPTYAEVLRRRPFTPPHRPASPARPNPTGKSLHSSGIPRTDGRFEWIRRTESRAWRSKSPARPAQRQRASPPLRHGRPVNLP
jgi:hypothetical protein